MSTPRRSAPGSTDSADDMKYFLTTAIDYANAAPHMGHVMEKILADVVARWFRLRGDAVLFQIGMDEHGIMRARPLRKPADL